MDDGTRNKGYYRLATCCFSEEEHTVLISILRRYDLTPSVSGKLGRQNLTFIGGSSFKFKSLVLPFMVPSMLYKL